MAQTDSSGFQSIEALDTSSLSELRALYMEIHEVQAQQWASKAFLQGNIAWGIQARARNQDPAILRNVLSNTLNRRSGNTTPQHNPGTRLIREWQGKVYEVTILPKGYLWQGHTYRSLSRIAQEITGAKWSGPRFFGLTAPAK